MCLILMGWQAHPVFCLVMASNRDEMYRAPTQPLAWRTLNGQRILCGLDLRRGGTWMGIAPSGRFGAVTNVRQGLPTTGTATVSRGSLVPEFTTSTATTQQYATEIASQQESIGGFNLVVGDMKEGTLWWSSNRSHEPSAEVSPGIHGLSNAPALDAPWPKIAGGTRDFSQVLAADDGSEHAIDEYLAVLADRRLAARRELPDTGVGVVLERMLSARLVRLGLYGTRCSTVLRIRHDGVFDMTERSLDRFGRRQSDIRITGHLDTDR